MSATLTRKPDLKEKLEILAEVMRRDQSKLVDEAIGLCREHATLMLDKIRRALAPAERGEFVPEGEMDAGNRGQTAVFELKGRTRCLSVCSNSSTASRRRGRVIGV